MSDDLDPTTDPILRRLRRDRPVAGPTAEVRARHRAKLDEAMNIGGRRRRPTWLVAAAAACIAVVGGIALAAGDGSDDDRQVATGDGGSAESATDPDRADGGQPLTSDECGGPLPFDVPVPDGFDGPVPGPANGEPAGTSPDQLVAHWTDGTTDIEVRWPADADAETPELTDPERNQLEQSGAAALTGADIMLGIDRTGEAGQADTSLSESFIPINGPSERLEVAVTSGRSESPSTLSGEGMCGVVQILVRSSVGNDVRPTAERIYADLTALDGPLLSGDTPSEERNLVSSRTEAAELRPETPCDGPVDEPTASTPVDVVTTHSTADDALAAHLETQVLVDEGPFGTPRTTYTVPTSGYTAISLPDGRIAYEFPTIVAYFIAEEVDGGWAITRYEGPTC